MEEAFRLLLDSNNPLAVEPETENDAARVGCPAKNKPDPTELKRRPQQ